jgi:hypothetical protein
MDLGMLRPCDSIEVGRRIVQRIAIAVMNQVAGSDGLPFVRVAPDFDV